MVTSQIRLRFIKLMNRLNFIEKFILTALVIAFLYPLKLPNTYNFGYIEIEEPKKLCPHNDFDLHKNADGHYNNSEQFYQINFGGRYTNNHCDPNDNNDKTNKIQNVAIIVPFRNRYEHLNKFLVHLHSFLLKQNQINYQIFIIEQCDNHPFNRANLLNIGFVESLKLYENNFDCFIFHDVDILPMNIDQIYQCTNLPKHLCSYIDKFRYVLIYPKLFGGIITIYTQQFKNVNGYSNLYNGWGGEDDDFYQRITHFYDTIERYPKTISKCLMLKHKHEDETKNLNNRKLLLKNVIDRIDNDGLSTLNQTYSLKSVKYYPLYTKIQVELLLSNN